MPDSQSKPFKVKETKRFSQDVIKCMSNFKRWDEIKETIDLDLARNPTLFEQIPGTEYRAVTLSTTPMRTLYFSVDSNSETVILERLI